jgi:hypothetical protein
VFSTKENVNTKVMGCIEQKFFYGMYAFIQDNGSKLLILTSCGIHMFVIRIYFPCYVLYLLTHAGSG